MDDYQLTLPDYLAILRRRAWLVAGTFTGVLAVAAAAVLLAPSVYQSSATILIESQQIPTDLVQSAVSSYADERIEVIKQRVMTRENLLRTIRKYDLFAHSGPTFTPSEQIDVMRKSIWIDVVNASVRPERAGSAAIAFSIAFEARQPEIAQSVTSDLVTLFLDENTKVRTQRASQTTEFLTQESDKLKKELDGIEAQIAAYKQKHGAALPENIAMGMASVQRVEADLRQAERDYSSAEESLRTLESERGLVPAEPVSGPGLTVEGDLQRARTELARLGATYTENHPDLKAAKRRVESLERAVAAESGASRRTASNSEVRAAHIEVRARALRQRMRALEGQRNALRAKLNQMDMALVGSPQTERGLLALTRDYQSAQKKYEEILAKKMTAQVSESLEGEQKAERFRVLEPATLPDRPIRPDRKKLLVLSVMLAIGAAAAAVVFMESLHGVVRGAGRISAAVGQEPLVMVPVIPVASEIAQRRRLTLAVVGGGLLASCLALALVHFLLLPLDLLVMKAIIRLG